MEKQREQYRGWTLFECYTDAGSFLNLEARKENRFDVMHFGWSYDCLKRKVREADQVAEINGEQYTANLVMVTNEGAFGIKDDGVHWGFVPFGAGGFEAYGNSKEEVIAMLCEQVEAEQDFAEQA